MALVSAWGLASLCFATSGYAYAGDIVILKSSEQLFYTQAVEGFQSSVPRQTSLKEVVVDSADVDPRALGRRVRASNPDLVFAVGLKAALLAKVELPDSPVVFCLVLNPEVHGLPADNMVGIVTRLSPEAQLTAIRKLVPAASRIGLLYGDPRIDSFVTDAQKQAARMGLDLAVAQVAGPRDVPDRARGLIASIDLLWLIQDPTVISEESLAFLLQTSMDAAIPVFGFSSATVQQGALGALFVDPRRIGEQAGRLARDLLKSQRNRSRLLVPPDRPELAVNLNTAEYLESPVDQAVVRTASVLFGGPGATAQHRNR